MPFKGKIPSEKIKKKLICWYNLPYLIYLMVVQNWRKSLYYSIVDQSPYNLVPQWPYCHKLHLQLQNYYSWKLKTTTITNKKSVPFGIEIFYIWSIFKIYFELTNFTFWLVQYLILCSWQSIVWLFLTKPSFFSEVLNILMFLRHRHHNL